MRALPEQLPQIREWTNAVKTTPLHPPPIGVLERHLMDQLVEAGGRPRQHNVLPNRSSRSPRRVDDDEGGASGDMPSASRSRSRSRDRGGSSSDAAGCRERSLSDCASASWLPPETTEHMASAGASSSSGIASISSGIRHRAPLPPQAAVYRTSGKSSRRSTDRKGSFFSSSLQDASLGNSEDSARQRSPLLAQTVAIRYGSEISSVYLPPTAVVSSSTGSAAAALSSDVDQTPSYSSPVSYGDPRRLPSPPTIARDPRRPSRPTSSGGIGTSAGGSGSGDTSPQGSEVEAASDSALAGNGSGAGSHSSVTSPIYESYGISFASAPMQLPLILPQPWQSDAFINGALLASVPRLSDVQQFDPVL